MHPARQRLGRSQCCNLARPRRRGCLVELGLDLLRVGEIGDRGLGRWWSTEVTSTARVVCPTTASHCEASTVTRTVHVQSEIDGSNR